MNRLSTEKAKVIAAEYMLNGNNKVDALLKAGYSQSYSKGSSGKKVFQNILVCAEIERMQARTALKTDITVESIRTDLKNLAGLCLEKGDYSTQARCYELLGKSIAMFTDNLSTTDAVEKKKLDSAEAEEADRIANIRLTEMRKAI